MLLSSCLPVQWLGDSPEAEGQGEYDADEILEGDDLDQEAAVLGPDLRDGLPSIAVP